MGLSSVSSILIKFAKRSVAGRLKLKRSNPSEEEHSSELSEPSMSPLVGGSKTVFGQIGNKAGKLAQLRKGSKRERERDDLDNVGVWQKEILMGDKCQPLDFSGVIHYDCDGNRLDQVPCRSPLASPLPAYLSNRRGSSRH